MSILLRIVGYLAVGVPMAAVYHRYVMDDYDRKNFPIPVAVVFWPVGVFMALSPLVRAISRRLP